MEKATIIKLNRTFEESAYEQDGIEYWLARELQLLLGYADWRNFLNAVEKPKKVAKPLMKRFLTISLTSPKWYLLGRVPKS